MYGKYFSIKYSDEPHLYGNLKDSVNQDNFGQKLSEALVELFQNHLTGILISAGKSYGVMHFNDKYYFTDSHSCGPKGATAGQNGKACAIECNTLQEFTQICKRVTGSRNIQYTINDIDVHPNNIIENCHIEEQEQIQRQPPDSSEVIPTQSASIILQTSVMLPKDCVQPDVEDELEVNGNVNKIIRKTRDNIDNVNHEIKAEELSWFYLFPYSINGIYHTLWLHQIQKTSTTVFFFNTCLIVLNKKCLKDSILQEKHF